FFFQAEDGIRDLIVTGVQTCALPISGLGFRLRFLSGGMSPSARLVNGKVLPERSGYYVGWRMVDTLVRHAGIAPALRAAAHEFRSEERRVGKEGKDGWSEEEEEERRL